MKKLLITALIAAFVLTLAVPALADSPAQRKLLAKRAAQVDAYRNLAERIKGFQIDSSTSVKDFVTESDEINTHFRTFIKGAKVIDTRYYDDGIAEVDVQITLREVIETLKTITKRYYKGNRYREETWNKLETTVNYKTIVATGSGAERMAKEGDAADDYISPPPTKRRRTHIPDNWKRVSPQKRLMAKRAAQVDAYRNLAERVKGLRIDSQTHVRDFVTESDQINTELNTFLKGVKVIDTRYSPDELIVEVDVQLTLREIIEYLKTITKRYYKGNRYKEETFNQIRTETKHKVIHATGYGTTTGEPYEPPAPQPFEPEPEPEPQVPGWATKTIRATGQGVPSEDAESEAQAKLGAKRAAKLDAYRKLLEEVGGVQIDSQTTVKDFITENDEINAEAQGFIRGAKVVSEEFIEDEGIYEVTLEITLMDFYKLYKKHKK